jgi:plastocyanin
MRATTKFFLLLGLATAAVPAMPAGAAVTEVTIANFSFSPGAVTIAAGGTVKWTNGDNASHTVTADDGSFNSASVGAQGTFEHTFPQGGTFSYHCAIHPSMQGTVQVDTPTTTTTAAPTTTTTSAPTTTTTARATTTTTAPAVSAAPRTSPSKPAAPPPTAAPTATTLPPAAPMPSSTPDDVAIPPETTPSTQVATGSTNEDDGGGAAGWALPGLAAALLTGGGVGWWALRRRGSSPPVGG